MDKNNAVHLSITSIATSGMAVALLIVADARAEIESTQGLAATGAEELSRDDALASAIRQYDQAFAGGLFDEAATNAARYIRILLQEESFDKRDWANALVRMGNAQRQIADYGPAIENYELAIETLLLETNRLDESLIEPYLGAGEALAESGQYDEATSMLEYAVHLQKVNGGLYNIEQTTSLTQLSAVYLKLDDHPRALASQTSNLNIFDQNYPGDDIRKIPVMLAHARVLAETGSMVDSHIVYRRTISMIERAEGSQSPTLLPALYEMVDFITNNEIKDGFDGMTRARRFLQRAIYIAEHSEEATPIHRADAHIEMGDYLSTNTLDRKAAVRKYETAWQYLAGDAELVEELTQRFGQPTLLQDPPMGTVPDMRNLFAKLDKHGGDPNARISVRFDVDAEGLPRNIEIPEGISDSYWCELAVEHVDRFIFRPRLVDGKAAEATNMEWSFHYRVQGEDLDE